MKDQFISYLDNIQQLKKANQDRIEQLKKLMQQCSKKDFNLRILSKFFLLFSEQSEKLQKYILVILLSKKGSRKILR